MSIKRTQNWLPQQRVDLAHLRSVESSIAADFDVLAGNMIAGSGMVVRGFALSNIAAGTRAAEIQMSVAGAAFINQNATEAGSIFWVPENTPAETLNPATNQNVVGSFVANQTNYIGLDLSRTADDSTTDLVQFRDPNTLDESPRSVPLARTLRYRIVISTVPFGASPNLVPIAKVVTDGQNLIATGSESVVDARPMLFRLGSGGDTSNQYNSYSWPSGRAERDPNVLPSLNRFDGGDKTIQTQKDWMDAVMTRLWEVGGGQHWYSPTADRNIRLVGNGADLFTTTGDNFEWGGGTGTADADGKTRLRWRGLVMLFDNSDVTGVYYNTIADNLAVYPDTSNTLEVGECIYVDIDRTANATVTAHKGVLQTLGTPTVPGSRVVLAWRSSAGVHRRDGALPINTTYPVATTGAAGAVRLAYAAGTPATPTVNPLDSHNAISIGLPAYQVTTGSALYCYNTGATPLIAMDVARVATWSGSAVATYGPGNAIRARSTSNAIIGESRSDPVTLYSGTGVLGVALNGYGVRGTDDSGTGVYGVSVTGTGVEGYSNTGIAGKFSTATGGTALQVSGVSTMTSSVASGTALQIASSGLQAIGLSVVSTATGGGLGVGLQSDTTGGDVLALGAFASRAGATAYIRNYGSGTSLNVSSHSGPAINVVTDSGDGIVIQSGSGTAIDAYGDMSLGSTGSQFKFGPSKTGRISISGGDFYITGSTATYDAASDIWTVNAGVSFSFWATLKLPRGATITGIDVIATSNGTNTTSVSAVVEGYSVAGTYTNYPSGSGTIPTGGLVVRTAMTLAGTTMTIDGRPGDTADYRRIILYGTSPVTTQFKFRYIDVTYTYHEVDFMA